MITEFNGKPIHSAAELVTSVTSVPVGASVPIKVLRAGKDVTLTIKIAQRHTRDQVATDEQEQKGKKKGKKAAKVDTGMELEDLTPNIAKDLGMPESSKGVLVSATSYGGPADRAGFNSRRCNS